MKIRIKLQHGKWRTDHTGKGKFAISLIPELEKLGVEVTNSLEEFVDIDMQIGRFHYEPQNCNKTVLRIGPVHVDVKKNHRWLNDRKKQAYRKADGVIYQSKFGKKMVKAFIGEPRGLTTIINNGSEVYAGERLIGHKPINFLTCAHTWIKQKRLHPIRKAYWKSGVRNSCLWIAGDTGEKNGELRDEHLNMEIRRTGLLDKEELVKLQRLCDAQIHLVFKDCMPNAVCEGIANGCKIITNNRCGTAELVKQTGGIILKVDPKWDFKPININKPPKVDIDLLAQAMRDILKYPKPNPEIVDIRNIANKYKAFFEEVLKS